MQIADEKILEEEYQVWRKNIPYLYDLVYTQALKYLSPSIQWFPDAQRLDNNRTAQRLLSTTFTSGTSSENILISQIVFPDTVDEDALNNADIKFKVIQSIPSPIDINRLRFSPLATNIIACRTSSPDILIYDYTKHSSSGSASGPDAVLEGHTSGGFALDWNHNKFGQLVTGGEDNLVNIFDINIGLEHTYRFHDGIVNDVSFSKCSPEIFASVSDDQKLVIVDLRHKENVLKIQKAHFGSIETCSFSPFKGELIATGGSDTSIKVWDIRNTSSSLYTLRGHKKEVQTVKWSPHYESILGSSSKDRRVMVWDLNKTDFDSGESSPELLFIHGGHRSAVDDFDWNPTEPIEIASVSTDAMLQVWKIPLEDYI